MIKKENEMQDKILLFVTETSKIFGIGQHRIREILKEDYEFRYHLMVGRVIRKAFEEYINRVKQI